MKHNDKAYESISILDSSVTNQDNLNKNQEQLINLNNQRDSKPHFNELVFKKFDNAESLKLLD